MDKEQNKYYPFSAFVGVFILVINLLLFFRYRSFGNAMPIWYYLSQIILGIVFLLPMPSKEKRWQSPRLYLCVLATIFAVIAFFSVK